MSKTTVESYNLLLICDVLLAENSFSSAVPRNVPRDIAVHSMRHILLTFLNLITLELD
jgi:hypothetical protein